MAKLTRPRRPPSRSPTAWTRSNLTSSAAVSSTRGLTAAATATSAPRWVPATLRCGRRTSSGGVGKCLTVDKAHNFRRNGKTQHVWSLNVVELSWAIAAS